MRPAALAVALLLLAAPAAQAAEDPLEGLNRRTHALNLAVRAWVLAPAVDAWRAAAPPELRRGVANAFANLREPVTALSGLAAGDVAVARNAAIRFGINSTLGYGGVEDRAAAMGHAPRRFTPADALCAWGVPSGPYLVLPLLGPSSLRDAGAMAATGAALGQFLGPDVFAAWSAGDAFLDYEAGAHDALGHVAAHSLDAYATLRSAWQQRRAAACPADRDAALAEDDPAR
jgi:phospholipid-binding lipoprotein MlaA